MRVDVPGGHPRPRGRQRARQRAGQRTQQHSARRTAQRARRGAAAQRTELRAKHDVQRHAPRQPQQRSQTRPRPGPRAQRGSRAQRRSQAQRALAGAQAAGVRPAGWRQARPASAVAPTLALVAVAATVAGLAFHRAFTLPDLLPAVPVAAVVPVLLVGLARRRGRPAPLLVTTVVWAAAFAVWAAFTLARDTAGFADRLALVGTGLVDGWARLLDVTVPAPADPVLLVVPVAATWLAAAVGAEVAVRTSTAVLPVAPAVVVLAGAGAVAVPAPGTNLPAAAALAVVAALLAMVRAITSRHGDGPGLAGASRSAPPTGAGHPDSTGRAGVSSRGSGAGRAVSRRAVSGRAVSGRTAGGEAGPADPVTGLERLDVDTVPVKAVPVKAVPVKAVPVKAVPVKAVPAKAVPTHAVPAADDPDAPIATLGSPGSRRRRDRRLPTLPEAGVPAGAAGPGQRRNDHLEAPGSAVEPERSGRPAGSGSAIRPDGRVSELADAGHLAGTADQRRRDRRERPGSAADHERSGRPGGSGIAKRTDGRVSASPEAGDPRPPEAAVAGAPSGRGAGRLGRRSPADARDRAGGRARTRGRVRVGDRPSVRSVLLTVFCVVAVGAVGPLAGTHLAFLGEPVDPRDARATPHLQLAGLNPLNALAGWTARSDERLFTLSLSGPVAEPATLRLAVLTGFDGANWTSTATFVRVGRQIPADPLSAADPADPAVPADSAGVARVTQTIVVEALSGPMLPAVDRPFELDFAATGSGSGSGSGDARQAEDARQTPGPGPGSATGPGPGPATGLGPGPATGSGTGSGTGSATGAPADVDESTAVGVDPASGTLVRAAELAPGERYEVVSIPPQRRPAAELPDLGAGRGPDAEIALFVPDDVPPVVAQMANVAAGRGRTAFQQAALLEDYLSTNFVFDPTARPGHSLAHIEHFVAQTRRGTSEQFAATFALAARILGMPSRLVVGFTASRAAGDGGGGPGGAAGGGGRVVRGANALAWPEVYFDGAGWLPFFPTPAPAHAEGSTLAGLGQGQSAEQAAAIEAAVREYDETFYEVPAGPGAAADEPAARPDVPGSGIRPWLAVAGVGVALLLLAYLAVAVLAPAAGRRRRRRAAASRREQVVGAWHQTIEVLAAVGMRVPASASPTEVASLGAGVTGRSGGVALRSLATLVSTALFGARDTVEWTGPAGQNAADEAWRLAEAVVDAVRATVPLPTRIWRGLSPRIVVSAMRRPPAPASESA